MAMKITDETLRNNFYDYKNFPLNKSSISAVSPLSPERKRSKSSLKKKQRGSHTPTKSEILKHIYKAEQSIPGFSAKFSQ